MKKELYMTGRCYHCGEIRYMKPMGRAMCNPCKDKILSDYSQIATRYPAFTSFGK